MDPKKPLPVIIVVSAVLTLVECGGGGRSTVAQPTQPLPVTYSEQTVYNFGQAPDGSQPVANLVLDTQGNLYGTTMQGGVYGEGTVFKLSPGGGQWTETILYNFCSAQGCTDGAQPNSALILDSVGNLYGTTLQGGVYGNANSGAGTGVVFELSPQQNGTWTETVLHSFGSGRDGTAPMGGLTFDHSGNLYGTTYQGGTGPQCIAGCGTVFEISPGSGGLWTERVLYNFCSQSGCPDGENPTSGLLVDASGNVFGTTTGGGLDQSLGLIFELSPGSSGQWIESVIYQFQGGGNDGYSPVGRLVKDGSGNLYGATEFGYSYVYPPSLNNGTVFKLTQGAGNRWTETVVYGLCAQVACLDGSQPLAGIVLDKAGSIYGTTFIGGTSNWGCVFKLVPRSDGTWQQSTLYSFQGFGNGHSPAGVVVDSSGNIYGLAQGGANQNGMVFELAAH